MRVLLVGLDPAAVNFSDPALPPGLDAAKIENGIKATLADMRGRGWTADHCYITPDIAAAAQTLADALSAHRYDCLVIGGGVRLPPRNLPLFERLINTARKAAPGTAIAFNSTPLDSADAAVRAMRGEADAS